MRIKKSGFANNEHYHVFNRGVDKREIFFDKREVDRFLQSMDEFNVVEPAGGIYQNSFGKNIKVPLRHRMSKSEKLVEFVAYCLNPNHYHFILKQVRDDGISKFMQKLGNGYTKYFNQKNKRSGCLFQGKYKSVHIDSDNYLLHVSVYVNLNNVAHQIDPLKHPMSKSSWNEYVKGSGYGNGNIFCKNDIVLDQFENREEYRKFAENSLKEIQDRKEFKKMLLEGLD